MTRSQRNAISSPAEGLIVMCLDCSINSGAELTFYSSGIWYTMPKQTEWTCGSNFMITHQVGSVAPVSKQGSTDGGWGLNFSSCSSILSNYFKAHGFNVRCLRE